MSAFQFRTGKANVGAPSGMNILKENTNWEKKANHQTFCQNTKLIHFNIGFPCKYDLNIINEYQLNYVSTQFLEENCTEVPLPSY